MKRGTSFILVLCLLVALPAAPALAKKKHKKKPFKLGPVVTVTATGNTTSSNGAPSTAVASCPPGKQVIGGGFSAPVNLSVGALVIRDSYRSSAESWTVTARNLGGTGSATAYAYCRNPTKSPVSDISQSASFSTSVETKTVTPACPAGSQLVGGGFQSTAGPDSSDFLIIGQNAPAPGAAAWSVTAVNDTSSPQTLTAHAYCLAGIRAPRILSASSSGSPAPGEAIAATTPACPAPPKPKKKKGKKKKKKRPAQLLSAGGFNGPPVTGSGPALLWTDNLASTPGWKASATEVTTPDSVSITTYGLCV